MDFILLTLTSRKEKRKSMSSTLLIPSDVPVLFIFFFISFVVTFGADKSFNTMSIILLFEYRNGKKNKRNVYNNFFETIPKTFSKFTRRRNVRFAGTQRKTSKTLMKPLIFSFNVNRNRKIEE